MQHVRLYTAVWAAAALALGAAAGAAGAERPSGPALLKLPKLGTKPGILYEVKTAEWKAAAVRWTERGRPLAEPRLRVWRVTPAGGTVVAEGTVAGFPRSVTPLCALERIRTGSFTGRRTVGRYTMEVRRADAGGIEAILVNGKPQPLYDGVYAPRFSSTGRYAAYCGVSKKERKQFAVVNGRKQPVFDWCTGVVFSPNGYRWACVAGSEAEAALILNGRMGRKSPCKGYKAVTVQPQFGYQFFHGPEFVLWSADGRRVAHVIPRQLSGGSYGPMFLNGRPVSPVEAKWQPSTLGPVAAFSADGLRFAYVGSLLWQEECIVLDGKPLLKHRGILDFAFSPDGRRFAYIARDPDGERSPLRVYRGGKPGAPFDAPAVHGKVPWVYDLTGLVFSPDSRHLAYVARQRQPDKQWFVVLDGERGEAYDAVLTRPVFHEGKLLTLAVRRGEAVTRILLVAEDASGASRVDYQKAADGARWGWEHKRANPLYGAGQAGETYDVTLTSRYNDRFALTLAVRRGRKDVYEWAGHRHSVFRILEDRLYYAKFHPSSSGGTVVAVDLTTGKQLWQSRLKALGPVEHSTYWNLLNLDANYRVVTVWGKESLGRYLEFKDVRTGKTVGHRVFRD